MLPLLFHLSKKLGYTYRNNIGLRIPYVCYLKGQRLPLRSPSQLTGSTNKTDANAKQSSGY